MEIFKYNNKEYKVDIYGFIVNPASWDENFAEGIALELNISGGLTEKHWNIIRFIRETYDKTHSCPVVYDTCKQNNLTLHDLKSLFPLGYQRGACKIAGVTFQDGFLRYHTHEKRPETIKIEKSQKKYTIDVYGFLINPAEWDKNFAILMTLMREEKCFWEHLAGIFRSKGEILASSMLFLIPGPLFPVVCPPFRDTPEIQGHG